MFLSRYDGLRYFRVTPLGAVILGKRPAYNAPQDKPSVSLTVLRNSQVRIDAGKLTPEETRLFESFADREDGLLWSINEFKTCDLSREALRCRIFAHFWQPATSSLYPRQ